MKSTAQFSIMVPTMEGYRVAAIFYAKDEKALLESLTERLPSMAQDHALVALNEAALKMLLAAAVRRG